MKIILSNLRILLIWTLKPMKTYFKQLITEYNLKKKYSNLKLSGNFVIENTVFGKYNYVENAMILNSKINDFSYIGSNSSINNTEIGKFTCIGPDVKIGLGNHPVKDFVSIHPVFYSTIAQVGITFSDKNYFKEYDQTYIGNDVWIGAGVIVMNGVLIGDGAIIAAGAVVTKNIEPYSIVGGVPAKNIKKRFSDIEIEELLNLKWWDKDIQWLKENCINMHNIKNINLLKTQ